MHFIDIDFVGVIKSLELGVSQCASLTKIYHGKNGTDQVFMDVGTDVDISGRAAASNFPVPGTFAD
jgi:hypothetical protein